MVTRSRTKRPARTAPDDGALQRIAARRVPAAGGGRSLAEVACDEIRRAIRDGRVPTGAHLTENELAGWLGMSRTPVREAMRRLESEGLLLNQPFRGALVMRLDTEDMRQLYVVRELLEPAAAGWCAINASQADLDIMRGLLVQEKRELNNPSALIPINRQFHNAILDGARNQFLTKSIMSIHSLLPLLGDSNFLAEPYARNAHEQHCAMFEAIASRNQEAASTIALAHVRDSLAYRLARV